ncbi:MAG TPA: DUF2071 domain-containing protein [Salinimicrobium sp.]|nr:DUF2071 domain-containing protein [Salinimicrobium sp.]
MSLLTCHWRNLAFANYIISPEILEKYLPSYTKIDYFDRKCYVSLVGFQFKDIEIAGVKIPFYTDFEEINLRFYVKRFDGTTWRKGTVFISEIADKSVLKILANSFLHEKYQTLKTKQEVKENSDFIETGYSWKAGRNWQSIEMIGENSPKLVAEGTEPHFIMDRPWGYQKYDALTTNEYEVSHPQWKILPVSTFDINVDFKESFGSAFSILNGILPHSVILAEGSLVSVKGMNKITSSIQE